MIWTFGQIVVSLVIPSGEEIKGEVKSVLELYKCFYQKVAFRNKIEELFNIEKVTNHKLFDLI